MGEVTSVRGADRGDLLAAFHGFAGMHQHVLNVPIIRLDILAFASFEVGVQQNDNVAPSWSAFAREKNAAIGNSVKRTPQIAILAADPIQIVSEMFVVGKMLRVVSHRAVLVAEGKIKMGCRRNRLELER